MATNLPKLSITDAISVLKQNSKALRELKKVNPRERYVLLFPNSDAAHVGMGFKLLNIKPAERVYEQASEIVGKDLLKLCLNGPKSALRGNLEDRNVATFVTSHATIAKLSHERPNVIPFCKASGGIGVGFINSLVFGGAMTFENGLDLVRRQAEAMDRAAKVVPSARLVIHVKPATSKRRVCQAAIEHCLKKGIAEEIAVCSVTKQTHAHVIQVSGHVEAINYLERDGFRLFDFRELKRVDEPAYNTELMRPVRDFLLAYINQKIKENIDYLKEPMDCSVYSATAGYRLRNPQHIKKDLFDFPIRPIQIEQLLHCLYARPKTLAQPNTLVLWDKNLLRVLGIVNRRARDCAKLLDA